MRIAWSNVLNRALDFHFSFQLYKVISFTKMPIQFSSYRTLQKLLLYHFQQESVRSTSTISRIFSNNKLISTLIADSNNKTIALKEPEKDFVFLSEAEIDFLLE